MMNGGWGFQVGMAALLRNHGFFVEGGEEAHVPAPGRRRARAAAIGGALRRWGSRVVLALRAVAPNEGASRLHSW